MHRLAVLLSGRGSNFEAIADAVARCEIPEAAIVAVVSDHADAPGLARAREMGLPAFAVERPAGMGRAAHEAEIRKILESARPDLICLAGYMRVLSPEFVGAYSGQILNIHPSLLPKYPGLDVQRRALEAGDSESGCTVHYVVSDVDSGPVVVQERVPIFPGDTVGSLSERILEREHAAYPQAIRKVLSERSRSS